MGPAVVAPALEEPFEEGEPPPFLNRATAPQATSGTMMSTASRGIQLRHAGTCARCTPTGTGPSASAASNSSSGYW